VIGGLTVATLLTLVVIPCLYRSFTGAAEQLEPVHPGSLATDVDRAARATGGGGG
jgi:hypothetical protein